MPDELRAHPGVIPPHQTIGALEWVRIGTLILVLILMGALFSAVHNVTTAADRIIRNQDKGVALVCDQAARNDEPLPERCLEPSVLRFRETG